MQKVSIILHKEWLEFRQQRSLLFSIILLPLIFTILPVAIFAVSRFVNLGGIVNGLSTGSGILKLPGMGNLTPQEAVQAVGGLQYSLFYMLLPLMLPSIIASYSIIGEKTSRTLEPVLATPIRAWELLLGKSLIALLPALFATWVGGTIFIIATAFFALSPHIFAAVITPGWLIMLFLWTPLLSMIAIAAMIAVSSRVNDPRTAQQYSAWAVIPFMILFFGQLFGLVALGTLFAFIVFIVLIPLAILALWLASRLFQREVILTRWK